MYKKWQQAWNTDRTTRLGADPKEARRHLRESLQPGFYVAISSKKRVKTLHLLGSCYMILGIDYPSFTTQEKSSQTSVHSMMCASGVHGMKVHKTPAITHQTR